MKETLSMIISVILLVILLVLLPLYNYFERQDDMSYNVALKAVTTFVDEVSENGYIDQNMYDKFIQRIATTGNAYSINLEAQVRTLTPDPDGETDAYIEQYKTYYTKDILESGSSHTSTVTANDTTLKNNAFFMDKGDRIKIQIKNTNTTMATALLSALVPGTAREKVNITYGSTIKNNNWKNTTISQLFQSDILISLELQDPNEPDENNGLPRYNFEVAQERDLIYKVRVLNSDETNLSDRITDNIRLRGTNPDCYISPSNIQAGSEDGEYLITFTLKGEKEDLYFKDNQYNMFECFIPAGAIQGKLTKSATVSSSQIVIVRNAGVEVPK